MPQVCGSCGQAEPGNQIGEMIVAQCNASLSTYGTTLWRLWIIDRIEEDGLSARAFAHPVQIAIEIDLAIFVIWRELWTRLALAHNGRQFHLVFVLAQGACLLLHMFARDPASVNQDNVTVEGKEDCGISILILI